MHTADRVLNGGFERCEEEGDTDTGLYKVWRQPRRGWNLDSKRVYPSLDFDGTEWGRWKKGPFYFELC